MKLIGGCQKYVLFWLGLIVCERMVNNLILLMKWFLHFGRRTFGPVEFLQFSSAVPSRTVNIVGMLHCGFLLFMIGLWVEVQMNLVCLNYF